MNRFQRSWQLFKTSLVVMQRDPRLLLFPIFTAVCTVCIVLLFLAPVAFQPTGFSYTSGDHWKAVVESIGGSADSLGTAPGAEAAPEGSATPRSHTGGMRPIAVIWFAALYFASMFCATFFNVAFYSQILNALNGMPVSISGGLKFACSKWETILMWALFAGLVGYLIKMLEERFSVVGQWVMRLIGTAWSIACVFVIPVIITEEDSFNPLKALKKSALTLKQTWGESLIGYVGVSFGGAIILLGSLVWLGSGIALAMALKVYWLIALVVLLWIVGIVIWSYLLSVASQIFRCALYLYASQGSLPAPYTQEMMALAWKQKK